MPHYGLVHIPPDKALRAVRGVQDILDGGVPVAVYRRTVFFLQSLVFMVGGGTYRMRGLWRPLREDQELGRGPDTPVTCDEVMRTRLQRWRAALLNAPGISAYAAFTR
eukprot:1026170-Pleurochrysis_carterae.AAC.1